MNNIIKRKWNQNSMVIIEDLQGMAFQAESGGHTFQISGIDGEGNTVALSGTPAGVMLRADGQDVTLTCSVSEGVVSATLPANAYVVPGRFGLTIFLTSDGQKTAIYAAVGTVGKTSSGTVAPPAGSDVVTLVNQINTAIAAIPANYNACFAPAYSTSGLYSVGQYVTYNGNLYRCNTAITTAETWTAAHWTQTNLGADVYDLKSALMNTDEELNNVKALSDTIAFHSSGVGMIKASDGSVSSSSTYSHTDYINIEGYNRIGYKRAKSTNPTSDVGMAFYDENMRFVSGEYCLRGESSTGYDSNINYINVPSTAKYARFSIYTDTSTYGYFELYGKSNLLNELDYIQEKTDELYFPYGRSTQYYVLGETVSTVNGLIYSDNKRARTYFLSRDKRDAVEITGNNYMFRVFSYNTGEESSFDKQITGNWEANKVIGIPRDSNYFVITFKRTDEAIMQESDIEQIKDAIKFYVYTDDTLEHNGMPAEAKSTGDKIRNLDAKIDELTEGEIKEISFEIEGTGTISAATGETYSSDISSHTDYIDISGFSAIKYRRQRSTNPNAGAGIAFYNEGKEYIAGIPSIIVSSGVKYDEDLYETPVPENAVYVRCSTYTDTVTYGTFSIYGMNSIYVLMEESGKYPGFYTTEDRVKDVDTFSGVIALYDALSQKYPEYVTKNTLTSGQLTNYEYVFTIGNYNARNGAYIKDAEIQKPIVLITSGTHGYERSAVLSLYTFFKAMCDRDYRLNEIAYSAEYRVIPVVCPWGYNNDSRLNENSVNINRNFNTSDWTETGEGPQYSGSEPANQDETVLVQNWINSHDNAMLLIDWHNSEVLNEITLLIGASTTESMKFKKKYLLGINRIIDYWMTKRKIMPVNTYAYTAIISSTGTLKTYAIEKGVPAFTLETSWNIVSTGKHSAFSIGTGAEAFGNMMIGFKSIMENI